ncbi:hypothetical protein NKDENANG_00721 [Candidatus Entotheonellaceae bacterium PAL068K]
MRRVNYILLGLSLLVLCGGCVAAAVGVGAGAGTYSYIKGELQAIYSTQIERLWPLTLTAMQDLKLTVDSKQMDALGGTIEARRADGTPVKVHLKPTGKHSTRIGVRVGIIFGSRKKSERIHNAIKKRLDA